MPAIGRNLTRWLGRSSLRTSAAVNVASYVLAVLASLATFRLMIVLTDTPTVGLWALISGLSAMIFVGEMGLGGNLTRLVASRADVSRRLLARLIGAGTVLCILPAAALSLAIAWPIYQFAATRPDLPVTSGDVALLTALALAGMLVNVISLIVSGLAEGLGRLTQRSTSTLLYNATTLAALGPAVGRFGAVGIGLANLVGLTAQFVAVTASLLLAARKLPRTGGEPGTFAWLRELFVGTMQNLGATLLLKTLEPVARFYVALGGSLTAQAWFELAIRVCNQVRSVAAIGLQPLLYFGASDRDAISRRFEKPQAFAERLSALLYLGLACSAPIISAVLFGQIEQGFVVYVLILGLGSAVNMNGFIGYFAMVAHARFGLLFKIAAISWALNAVVGLSVALGAGPFAGAAGLSLALGICGLEYLRCYARIAGKPVYAFFGGFWAGSLAAIVVGGGLALAAERFEPATVLALAAGSCLLLIAPAWSLGWMFLGRTPGAPAGAGRTTD